MYVGAEKYVGILVFLEGVFLNEGCLGACCSGAPSAGLLSSGERSLVASHSLPQCLHKQYPGILPPYFPSSPLPISGDVVYIEYDLCDFFFFCFDKLF